MKVPMTKLTVVSESLLRDELLDLMRKAGATVVVAENGLEGYELATASERDGEPFDVVLMDMQMPELNGWDATRQIRSAGINIPIVALTAFALPEDRERCFEAGCTGFAPKPIDRDELFRAIEESLQLVH